MGTYNRLAFLGDTYLELIGVFDAGAGALVAGVRRGQRRAGAPRGARRGPRDVRARHRRRRRRRGAAARGRVADRRRRSPGSRRRPDGEVVRWASRLPGRSGPSGRRSSSSTSCAGAEWGPEARAARAAFRHPVRRARAARRRWSCRSADAGAVAREYGTVLGIAFTEGWRATVGASSWRCARASGAGRDAAREPGTEPLEVTRFGVLWRRMPGGGTESRWATGPAPRARPSPPGVSRRSRRLAGCRQLVPRTPERSLRDASARRPLPSAHARRPRHHPRAPPPAAACPAFLARPDASPGTDPDAPRRRSSSSTRRWASTTTSGGSRRGSPTAATSRSPRTSWVPASSRCCIARFFQGIGRVGTGRPYREMAAFQDWLARQPYVDARAHRHGGLLRGRRLHDAVRGPRRAARCGRSRRSTARCPGDESIIPDLCPTVASYGGRDRVFGALGPTLEAALDDAGHPQRREDLPGRRSLVHEPARRAARAPRAAPPMHDAFDEAASTDAWARVLAFFGEHLAGGPAAPPDRAAA